MDPLDNNQTLLRIRSAADVEAEASAQAASDAEAAAAAKPSPSGLLARIERTFTRNREHRTKLMIADRLLDNLRAFNCQYSPDKSAAIKQAGQPEVYLGLTAVKSRAAVAWLTDIFTNEQERTWSFKASPSPELPEIERQAIVSLVTARYAQAAQQITDPAQMQALQTQLRKDIEAETQKVVQEALDERERIVHDQLAEGGFQEAFRKFLWDLVVMKAGIIKGPVVQRVLTKQWKPGVDGAGVPTGVMTMEVAPTNKLMFECINPLDAFPSPNDTNFEYDFISRRKYPRKDLYEMRGSPGWDSAAIDQVLATRDALGELGYLQGDQERSELEIKASPTDTEAADEEFVTGLECWMSVPGADLLEIGMLTDKAGSPIEPLRSYDMEIHKVGGHLIFIDFSPDPLGRKPFAKMGWSEIPGSFWYAGLPELMADIQAICNASARSLVYNLGIAAGPQAVITDVARLPAGEDPTQIFPAKVWQFTNKMNSTMQPVLFTQPDSNANELLAVYNQFSKMADDYTGVPAYSYGNDQVAGAGRTMGGLSMLMSNSARGIKRVVLDIDTKVVRPLIERVFDWNMRFRANFAALGGDVQVVPMGAVALMAKEAMSERRMAFLQATANPMDIKVTGYKGRAVLLRESAKTLELAGQSVVKSDEELDRMEAADAQAAQAAQQAEADSAQQTAALAAQKLKADMDAKAADIQLKREAAAIDAESRRQEAEFRRQELAMELEIKKAELELKRMDLEIKSEAAGTAALAAQTKAQEESARAEPSA